ncbi:hypothetical protein MUO14_19130 [Halobacillus shinanisalinarum]|uniref:Uncharacterized protein n=1 Tax=Halobacillus shinanisalinarum TaxID=2932258 RepID=A0ABY4GXV0_9BACI|nr:hypothetical protein [Halobacillus shinanisalinarum]UOQ92540.1 hypothetical protein MUO14_19130 [Halobacillus shinanisalinarum]
MRRKKLYVIIGIALTVFSIIYVNNTYFFNPLFFEQDKVTSHDWSDYERPLKIKLYNYGEKNETFTIKKESEVRQFLTALKSSDIVEEPNGRSTVIGGLTLSTKDTTLLKILFHTNHWEVLKHGSPSFEMTSSLKELFQKY